MLSYLGANGRRVPRDLSIVSREEETFLRFIHPTPTCYSAPAAKFAHTLHQVLKRLLASDRSASLVLFAPHLRRLVARRCGREFRRHRALPVDGEPGLQLRSADLLLLAAMACAATGYGWGARLSGTMRAEHVISWALLLTLPINLPIAWAQWPEVAIRPAAWLSFAYVAVFSMWLGFFAWYRALALGGTVRVSQVQLIQPFLSMLFAVPLLGETLDATTLGFGLVVVATVFVGRKMPVSPPPES